MEWIHKKCEHYRGDLHCLIVEPVRDVAWLQWFKNCASLHWLKQLVPIVQVLQSYNARENIIGDLIVGLTFGLSFVPQMLSFAKVSGLPNAFMMYFAFMLLIPLANTGSSRQLGVRPIGITALLLRSGLEGMGYKPIPNWWNEPDEKAEFNCYAFKVLIFASFMYAACHLVGIKRFTNFLRHSVIHSFLTGASIIIGMGQLQFMFGLSYNQSSNRFIQTQLQSLFGAIWNPEFKCHELLIGICCICFILGMRKIGTYHINLRCCSHLAVMFVAIVSMVMVFTSRKLNIFYSYYNDRIVFRTQYSYVYFFKDYIHETIQVMVLAAIINFAWIVESASNSQHNNYNLDAANDLRGLGDIVKTWFFPQASKGSSSCDESEAGTTIQVAGLFAVLAVVVLLLLMIMSWDITVPLNALAAIIITSLPFSFDYQKVCFLWKVSKFDCFVATLAFSGTIFWGLESGLAITFAVPALLALFHCAFPYVSVMGQLPGTTIYRNIKLFPEARQLDGFLILRIDSPVFFANLNHIAVGIDRAERHTRSIGHIIHYLVLDLAATPDIDEPAVRFILDLVEEESRKDVQVVLVQANKFVTEKLRQSALNHHVGLEFIGTNMPETIRHCQLLLGDKDSCELYGTISNSPTTNLRKDFVMQACKA